MIPSFLSRVFGYPWSLLFKIIDEPKTAMKIILWWEKRRLVFNGGVGLAGLVSVILIYGSLALPPADTRPLNGVEPITVIVFGILANLLFLGGWIIEIGILKLFGNRIKWFGPIVFGFGFFGSMVLAILPGFIYLLFWVGRMLGLELQPKP